MEKLREAGVTDVQVDINVGGKGSGTTVAITPVEAYAACVAVADEMQEAMAGGVPPDIKRLRHIVQGMVDEIVREPESLLALTTIKEPETYLVTHSTNVAILSVILGSRLGLTKAKLGELCLSAFLHDAGKVEVRPEVVNKPGALEPDEWEEMRRHPALAARALMRASHLQPSLMRSVIVAFEHHLHLDMTGYPKVRFRKATCLFSRIVSIVDTYDALITPRVYRVQNFTPHQALHYLLTSAGSGYDTALVKLFVEIMGLFPVGSVVELSDGQVGVVWEPPASGSALDRPRVRLLEHPDRPLFDLSEATADGRTITVRQVLNPNNQGLVPAVDLSHFVEPVADERSTPAKAATTPGQS